MDIRWIQRFNNFHKAFSQLERFTQVKELNEMEQQGLIKAFEYTYELAWKTLQDLLKHKGYNDIVGPRPVIEQSFKDGYIVDGNAWMRMHKSRNLSSHTYDENTADEIIDNIHTEYYQTLKQLIIELTKQKGKQTLADE